jgi:hypothetical protein
VKPRLLLNQACYSLKAAELFEVTYALLSQLFLHEIETVSKLVDDLKFRFSSEWVILKGIMPTTK